MCTRGLRPRAIRWVCSAYLRFAAPREGCRGKQFAQAEIQNAFADLLIQHPGGMQAYSPGSKTPGTHPSSTSTTPSGSHPPANNSCSSVSMLIPLRAHFFIVRYLSPSVSVLIPLRARRFLRAQSFCVHRGPRARRAHASERRMCITVGASPVG